MGGAIALQTGFRSEANLGAIFALSCYLNHDSKVYGIIQEKISNRGYVPPVWYAHGKADDFIHTAWGEATSKRLTQLGVDCEFSTMPGLQHEMNTQEIRALTSWIIENIARPQGP